MDSTTQYKENPPKKASNDVFAYLFLHSLKFVVLWKSI
jgi:hypothetical protein